MLNLRLLCWYLFFTWRSKRRYILIIWIKQISLIHYTRNLFCTLLCRLLIILWFYIKLFERRQIKWKWPIVFIIIFNVVNSMKSFLWFFQWIEITHSFVYSFVRFKCVFIQSFFHICEMVLYLTIFYAY